MKPVKPPEPKVFSYKLNGGWIVMAGKTEADNDLLSLKNAAPSDFWFHVHGMPGSHVILKSREDEQPDKDVLKQAAAIAAYHSKARNAGVTPVSCTLACNVTKPKGAKPGTVQIKRERIFKVRPAIPADSME